MSILETFLKKGAKLNKIFHGWKTLIHHAAGSGNFVMVNWLIDHGFNVNTIEKDCQSPLHAAVHEDNNIKVISILLDHGADINYLSREKLSGKHRLETTPLHLASMRNDTCDNINFLIKKGAQIDMETSEGETPLHFAALYNEEPKIIACLLENGAYINKKNKNGITPLYYATHNKNSQIAIDLIRAGASINDEISIRIWFRLKLRDTTLKRLKRHKDWRIFKTEIQEGGLNRTCRF